MRREKAVCGSDGKTYANKCEMRRAACEDGKKITVKSKGKCKGIIYYFFPLALIPDNDLA